MGYFILFVNHNQKWIVEDDPKTRFCQRSRPADVLHQLQNSNSQLDLGGTSTEAFKISFSLRFAVLPSDTLPEEGVPNQRVPRGLPEKEGPQTRACLGARSGLNLPLSVSRIIFSI